MVPHRIRVHAARRRPELLDERGAVGVERTHLGVDVGDDAIDRHEQRELAGAERVEDLPVVVTRPHRPAVGDDSQARRGPRPTRGPSAAPRAHGSTTGPRRGATARPAGRRDRGTSTRRRPASRADCATSTAVARPCSPRASPPARRCSPPPGQLLSSRRKRSRQARPWSPKMPRSPATRAPAARERLHAVRGRACARCARSPGGSRA